MRKTSILAKAILCQSFLLTYAGRRDINPKKDVAVVSTSKLTPMKIATETEYELFVDRTLKVSLHEVGYNFGLTDHA